MLLGALLAVVWVAVEVADGVTNDRYATAPERYEPPLLPVSFAHRDHNNFNCVACHHNFADDTGIGLCFDCHKTEPTVAHLIEDQFHDLCRGCHVMNVCAVSCQDLRARVTRVTRPTICRDERGFCCEFAHNSALHLTLA